MNPAEAELAGTPYLTYSDAPSVSRYLNVQERSKKIREHAIRVQEHISNQAAEILQPYRKEIRSSLVSESNRIEDYDWTADAVREAADTHRELMSAELHRMLEALKSDPKVFQAVGLYRAHELAETWAESGIRPNATEIRALHQLIAAGERHAGRYKRVPNEIKGSKHKPVDPIDAQAKMYEMVDWWRASKSDPILDATVVHAWLTHIHPFEDGNGRLARLLANLTLIQSKYPPLLLRHDSDRGQYYDALVRSDDGDILPLYDLFAQVTRRTVRLMAHPDYVQDIINKRLLSSRGMSHSQWQQTALRFLQLLREEFRRKFWRIELMGTVDLTSFSLLLDFDSSGNTWFFVVTDGRKMARWLVWFGYNSPELRDLDNKIRFPSLFFSVRDDQPGAVHPYRHLASVGEFMDEIVIRPLQSHPVLIRKNDELAECSLEDGARLVAKALIS